MNEKEHVVTEREFDLGMQRIWDNSTRPGLSTEEKIGNWYILKIQKEFERINERR